MAQNINLTDKEKDAIKVLNFVATFDGIIQSEDEIKYILQQGIEKFIPKKKRHLVSITKDAYPIKIKYISIVNKSKKLDVISTSWA